MPTRLALDASRFRFSRPPKHRRAKAHLKAAVAQTLEFNVLLVPNCFERMYRRASRLCFALLKFVDRPLCQARSPTQLSLAPPEHRPHDADLGRKSLPLEAHNLVETTRLSIELYCHCATNYRQ